MEKFEISNAELEEILNMIMQYYGYDFRDYSAASVKRRLSRFMEVFAMQSVFDLKYSLINNKEYFGPLLQYITVNVTEMFRDPEFYQMLREQVLPMLSAYPSFKIWHAGCSTGEEVFSMCILLEEEGLLNRARIYATDIDPSNLEKARKGIITLPLMKQYTQNYHASGGKRDFSNYYTARYERAIIDRRLTEHIVFSRHNLASESSFNEFHLIICRNVLIYFNKDLQKRVFKLFFDSLIPKGFLAIGIKESLLFSGLKEQFDTIDIKTKIYKRKL